MNNFDFFFMSYDEPKAEENFKLLKERIPYAKRVHRIKGIARAWHRASELAESSHFYTMDGDSQLLDDFDLNLEDFQGSEDRRVHVFRCLNHVNGLIYGYGSIHCFHTEHVRNFKNLDVVDFTLSVATKGFKIQPKVISTTHFNTSEYISFKSGFREASKLASKTNSYAGTRPDKSSINRLKIWNSLGRDVLFGEWVILGARMGTLFGLNNINYPEKLALISDHSWFQNMFNELKNKDIELMLKQKREEINRMGLECINFSSEQSRLIKSALYNV